eukprot:Gb_03778 [translate_table: standard]
MALDLVWAVCFVLALQSMCMKAQGNEFKVGGGGGWRVPTGSETETYNKWAERNRFQVGDTLLFKYKPNGDSVLQVSPQDYNTCNTSKPIASFNDDGNTEFKFPNSGPFYFISGASGNCEKGQKLVVVVMYPRGRHAKAPAPMAVSPTPTTSSASAPAPMAISPTPTTSPASAPAPMAFSPTPTISPASAPAPMAASPTPTVSPASSPSPTPTSSISPSPSVSSPTPSLAPVHSSPLFAAPGSSPSISEIPPTSVTPRSASASAPAAPLVMTLLCTGLAFLTY